MTERCPVCFDDWRFAEMCGDPFHRMGSDYDALAAEVERLRSLMIDISRKLGWGAHIQVRYEGTTPLYTCGIHNIDMSAHGNRCPACDAITEGDPNV